MKKQNTQMGRKLNFSSFFSRSLDPTAAAAKSSSSSNSTTSTSSWAHWPSCKHPRTKSFHYKREHSVFFKSNDSFFTQSPESLSNDDGSDLDDVETIIRGLMRSNRLFFEPHGNSSSILEEATESGTSSSSGTIPFKGGTIVVAMESEDPYNDFTKSMEEMVVAHGLINDWDCLEDLLVWYLRVNGKKNHGYIIGAFVDLLVALSSSSESLDKDIEEDVLVVDSCCDSNSSPFSFEIDEVEEEEGEGTKVGKFLPS